jgi:hypothetical protein
MLKNKVYENGMSFMTSCRVDVIETEADATTTMDESAAGASNTAAANVTLGLRTHINQLMNSGAKCVQRVREQKEAFWKRLRTGNWDRDRG